MLLLVPVFLYVVSLTMRAEKIALFDGKSLEGWHSVGSAEWRVEDGIITGGQDGDPRKSGILMTKRLFKDFDLELNLKLMSTGNITVGCSSAMVRERGGSEAIR